MKKLLKSRLIILHRLIIPNYKFSSYMFLEYVIKISKINLFWNMFFQKVLLLQATILKCFCHNYYIEMCGSYECFCYNLLFWNALVEKTCLLEFKWLRVTLTLLLQILNLLKPRISQFLRHSKSKFINKNEYFKYIHK